MTVEPLAETAERPRALSTPATILASVRRPARISLPIDVWRRRLVIGLVIAYAAILVLAPLGALVSGAFAQGLGAVITALSEPDVLDAFGRTLLIALIVVVVHS